MIAEMALQHTTCNITDSTIDSWQLCVTKGSCNSARHLRSHSQGGKYVLQYCLVGFVIITSISEERAVCCYTLHTTKTKVFLKWSEVC